MARRDSPSQNSTGPGGEGKGEIALLCRFFYLLKWCSIWILESVIFGYEVWKEWVVAVFVAVHYLQPRKHKGYCGLNDTIIVSISMPISKSEYTMRPLRKYHWSAKLFSFDLLLLCVSALKDIHINSSYGYINKYEYICMRNHSTVYMAKSQVIHRITFSIHNINLNSIQMGIVWLYCLSY